MRFQYVPPAAILKSFVKGLAISESAAGNCYPVFPSTGLVAGFQYKGALDSIQNGCVHRLAPSGITGISDRFKTFQTAAPTGTILVYFTETGLAQFTSCPAQEFFNQSIGLEMLFHQAAICEVEDRLAHAPTDAARIAVVEHFLITQLKNNAPDKLVAEAVQRIQLSKGTIRIKELSKQLFTSASPLEKRFRKIVGTSPKKFASIVRFNSVLAQLSTSKSLTEISYENAFFDQSHFIKDFKRYTGSTLKEFRNAP